MPHNARNLTGHGLSEDISSRVRKRVKALVLASTLTVALTFGLSFYFALISNESAIARQVPELEAVVSRLKSLLIINTFTFAAVIIASLYVLSLLVTTRMFRPLGSVTKDLLTLGEGRLPAGKEMENDGALSGLEASFDGAVSALNGKEKKELKELEDCLEILSDSSDYACSLVSRKLQEVIKSKNIFLGNVEDDTESKDKERESDPLFMQPV